MHSSRHHRASRRFRLIARLIAGAAVVIGAPLSAQVAQPVAPPRSAPAGQPGAANNATEREVEFAGGAEGVILRGTLLLPPGASAQAPVPGVLLITGSGIQDRDETIMGRKPFRVLAEALTARGYAVLRYDDRGSAQAKVGRSTGPMTGFTLADQSLDASRAMAFLGEQAEVDERKLVACGHSTGGIEVAALVARREVSGAAVLLASPCVRGGELVRRQGRDILLATHAMGQSGMTDEQVRVMADLQERLATAAMGDDDAALRSAAEEIVRYGLPLRAPGMQVNDQIVAQAIAATVGPFKETWMAHFLRHDPGADLATAKVPVLAVFGGRDLQVHPALNAGPASEALSRAGVAGSRVVVLPLVNHLFQVATTGVPTEYGTLTGEMGPELSSMVADWLDDVLRVGADSR